MHPGTIPIKKIQSRTVHGSQRVTAEVAGREIWFASRDLTLRASGEAFVSALLIPALHRGVRLALEVAVCPKWQVGAEAATTVASQWWQLERLIPETRSQIGPTPAAATGTGLCFTGGLDSFHSLLRGKYRPTFLVFVHGYDIPLSDETRLLAFADSLRQVATQYGAKPVIVSTNLREHPLVNAVSWTLAHGGALAAIGHLLSGHASRMIVASSVPRTYNIPWGSHWELDPLWSSGALQIIHDGADFSREAKAWAIASEPVLTRHLRVCWENRSPAGNCSLCDKCINTMLLLRQAGHLDAYSVFQKPEAFVPLIDALPHTTFVRVYRAMSRRGLPADETAAVQRLLERTERNTARVQRRQRVRKFFNRILFKGSRVGKAGWG